MAGSGGYIRRPGRIGPKQGIFEESATAKHRVGEKLCLEDGSVFYYAKASEALSKGKITTFKATTFNEDTVTVAHAIGTTAVTITASAAIAANQLADGWLVVDEGTGAGDRYKIKDHLAISNGATGVINLYDGLRTAWATADTDITLYVQPYSEIQESNTDAIECPAGVPLIGITNAYYFWLQTWGFCSVLINGTASQLGNLVTERQLTLAGTAGAVDVLTVHGAGGPGIGQALLDAADYEDAKYALVFLQINP